MPNSSSQPPSDSDPVSAQKSDAESQSHAGRWKKVDPEKLPHIPITVDQHNDDVAAEPQQQNSQQPENQQREKKKGVELDRRQELERQLRSNPTDLPAFRELAGIYHASNRPVEARRVLKQALEIFPKDLDLLWEYEEAVLARSLQQLREVTDLATRLQTPETDRELKRSRQDWAQRRIEVCRARLDRDPSLIHLAVSLGEAYHDAEEYKDAMDTLGSVVDHDELSPPAYLLIGRCLLAEGKDVEAMAALRACATRRSVVAPARIRVKALRLLCDTAERLGTGLTLDRYRQALSIAENEIAQSGN